MDGYLSHAFLIQNGLKQGDSLSPLLFNIVSEYAIWKVQDNQVGLEFNVTHQLLFCADDVSMLDGNINTMKRNTEVLFTR
jgi:hypothetical protein